MTVPYSKLISNGHLEADSLAKVDLEICEESWYATTPHSDGFGTVETDKNLNYIYKSTIMNLGNNEKVVGLKL